MNDSRGWHTVPGKKGLLYREHATRKYARKMDRFWAIRHTVGGQRITETLGWASEGWTVDMAMHLLAELGRNAKMGIHPQTLKEKREIDLAAKEAERRRETLEAARNITFGELAELYRQWAMEHRRSWRLVARNLDKHILPVLENLRATEITPSIVDTLRKQLEDTRPERGLHRNDPNARLSPDTVLGCLKIVREVYNFAMETPHPTLPNCMLFDGGNPAMLRRRGHGVRIPKTDTRRMRILTDAEIAALLFYTGKNTVMVDDLRDMMLLSLDTGLRAGELVRLRIEDVDAGLGVVRVFSGSDAGTTKSGRTRVIHAGYLFPEALPMLRRRAAPGGELVFPGKNGAIRDVTAVSRSMHRLADALKLNENVTDPRNRVVWHTLRHTFATRMLESGVDIYTLKELLGHSNVTVTEGYLHLCDRAKREQALARLALQRGAARVPAH